MNKAIFIVHRPNQDIFACIEHANQIINLGSYIGITCSVSICNENLECENCKNEQEKKLP